MLISLTQSISAQAEDTVPRIYNGLPVSSEDYPFYVALASGETPYSRKYLCNGAFITAKWIITAAHCVWAIRFVKVAVGFNAWKDINFKSMIQVEKKYTHPIYSKNIQQNDLAVVKLPSGYVTPFNLSLPLPSDDVSLIDTENLVTIISMGSTITEDKRPINDTDGILKRVDLRSMQTSCIIEDKFLIRNGYEVCTTSYPPHDQLICAGDSGSTGHSSRNITKVLQVVVTSGEHDCHKGFNDDTLRAKTAAFFIRVKNYTPWILHVIDADSMTRELEAIMNAWMVYPHLLTAFLDAV